MPSTVYIAEDPLNLEKWSMHQVEGDVRDFLVEYFEGNWPETARIYNKVVSQVTDVTPSCESDIERLGRLEGPFYVVIYPAGPVAAIVAVVVAVIAIVAVVFLLTPKIPTPAIRIPNQGNRQDSSPNNELSERTNRPRVNGRIPDIFGQVRSTPDLIGVPYRVYNNHQEIEIAYMCVGRGAYEVDDIRDGETLVEELAGTTVEVYAPNTSPNSGHSPQLRIGTAIGQPVVKVVDINAVNGQTLRSPNSNSVTGASNIRFEHPDTIHINSESNTDFTDFFATSDVLEISNSSYTATSTPFTLTSVSAKFTFAGEVIFQSYDPTTDFAVGDTFTIANASRTNGVNPVNLAGTYTISGISSSLKKITLTSPATVNADWNILDLWAGDETAYGNSDFGITNTSRTLNVNGTYTVLSVSANDIGLSSPAAVNPNWNWIEDLVDERTPYGSAILQTSGNKWIGPFFLDVSDLEQVFCNFVAANGLYKDNGNQQTRFDVVAELELTPVDEDGDPIGSAETFQGTIVGSATSRDTRAVTIKANPTFTGRCKARARRVTNADLTFNGTVVDEIKWQKMYAISPVTQVDFGNVTTVYSQTYATTGALSIKERKLNMLATRKINTRVSGSTFSAGLTATKSADEILSFICLDPYIGNRSASEIDFDSVYNTIEAVKEYFKSDVAAEFSYTFDSDNLSFEETIASLAEAVFCTAYRQGNQIKLSFEKVTDDSSLIFNHRNKLPGSETRTVTFGYQDNHDGIELDYVSPEDDVIETYYIPPDRSAINPREVETMGVRTKEQAFWHAWRVWNKLKYQNTLTEFKATQEAAITIIKERVLVADNTRPHTQDGEILEQSGLTLTLSQPVTFEDDKTYQIFLQHYDGTVEALAVTAGSDSYTVVLGSAPKQALAVDEQLYARCTYIIVADDDPRTQAFLIVEKEPEDSFTYGITAMNYTPLYYQQDNLELWHPFFENNYEDFSPFDVNGTAVGGGCVSYRQRAGAGSSGCGCGGLCYPALKSKQPECVHNYVLG